MYKRQAECAIPADIADEVEALRAELMEAAAGADEELMEKFFETMEPVSYTHLDVYKRQRRGRTARAS